MSEQAAAADSRSTHVGQYSAWLSKVKSEGARARWFSGDVKRYFTLDFDARIFSYSHTADRKKISQPIPFKEIVDAEQLPQSAQPPKGEFAFGFTVITCEKTYELFTVTYLDAKHWVEGLNAARDIGKGIHPTPTLAAGHHAPYHGEREPSRSVSSTTADGASEQSSGNSSERMGARPLQQQGAAAKPPPWAPQPVQRRCAPVAPPRAPAAEVVLAPAPEPVDPFAALDALEELAGPAPESAGGYGGEQQLDDVAKQQLREARLLVTQGKKPSKPPEGFYALAAQPTTPAAALAPALEQQPLPGPAPPPAPPAPPAPSPAPAPAVAPAPPAPVPTQAAAPSVRGPPAGPPPASSSAPAPADEEWDIEGEWAQAQADQLPEPPPLPPPPPAAPASGFAAAAEPSDWNDGDVELPAPQTYAAYGQPLDSCGAPPPPAQAFVKARLPPPPAPAAGGSELDDLVGELIADDTPDVPAGTSVYVPGMQCTNCDFQVMRISGMVWSNDVDYMFFRNGYPNVQRLQEGLHLRAACYAYCCQCSWRSADSRAELADVMDGLRWRMIS